MTTIKVGRKGNQQKIQLMSSVPIFNKINDSKYLSSNDGNITLLSNEDENGEKDEEDNSIKSYDLDNCKETDNVQFGGQVSHSHRYKDVGTNAFMKGYN